MWLEVNIVKLANPIVITSRLEPVTYAYYVSSVKYYDPRYSSKNPFAASDHNISPKRYAAFYKNYPDIVLQTGFCVKLPVPSINSEIIKMQDYGFRWGSELA